MKIGVVGLGYVGVPLAVAFCEAGHSVVGVDCDPRRVDALARGESHVEDIPSARLRDVLSTFRPTVRYAELSQADVVLIAVPTPLTVNREPDLGPLTASASALAAVLQRGQLVVLESTTYPGYTRERLVPLLEESGLAAGTDFAVAFSPERVDPGRTDFTLRTTPKVVVGFTEPCLERAVALYGEVCDNVVSVSTLEAAELTKLLAGGHCLPVDPFYLSWRAREYDLQAEFIELAGEVNQGMPHFCVEKITRALNERGKPVRGSRIAIVGVSYKAGIGDLREAPALKIMRLLGEQGGELAYNDDFVPALPEFEIASEPLGSVLEGCDAAVIVTAHPGLDVDLLVERAPLVVDFRGATAGKAAGKLVRL